MEPKRRVRRTREQIKKSNLAKTLDKIKISVAEKEELWLEIFTDVLLVMLGRDNGIVPSVAVGDSARIADYALSEYEERWGESK